MQEEHITRLETNMTALRVQQGQIMARLQHGEQNGMGQSSSHHLDGSEQGQVLHGRVNYLATRQAKVDFPRFSGNDLNGWLFRCQHFFEIDQTPEEMKVKLAAMNLEGRALQWHQNWIRFKKGAEAVTWEAYIKAVEGRFGEHNGQEIGRASCRERV